MRDFNVVTSDEAMADADQVYDYICDQLFAPMTAALYYKGLIDTMRKLGKNADSRAIDLRLSTLYRRPTRRVNGRRNHSTRSLEY